MSLAFNVLTDSINEWLAPDFDVLEFDSTGSPRVLHRFCCFLPSNRTTFLFCLSFSSFLFFF